MPKKKPKPKASLKKRTPDRVAPKAGKKPKQQGNRAQQTFIDNLVGDEDFSQAAARIVREATENN